ncbi:MAG: hypothetical protein ACOX31_05415 [Eubacteriales bacterium]|jgi:hypothetical protein
MKKEYEAPGMLIIPILGRDIITDSGDFDDTVDYLPEWELT